MQQNVDRLLEIICNYVAMNDIGYDNIVKLENLHSELHGSKNLENFWKNRFLKAKVDTKNFT